MFPAAPSPPSRTHAAELDTQLLLQQEALQPFASWVAVATRSRHVERQDLLAQLGPVLQRFGRERYPNADRAATVSQWSTDYFCATLIPLLGFAIIANARINNPEQALYRMEGPVIKAQIVDETLVPISGFTAAQYVFGYLRESESAFVRALAKAGHVSERLLWTNLAVVVDAVCASLNAFQEYGPLVVAMRQEIFSLQIPGHKSLLNDLLLEHPVPAADLPVPWLVRRVCCLHYRLDDKAPLCTSCPLLLRKPLQEQAAYLRSELT